MEFLLFKITLLQLFIYKYNMWQMYMTFYVGQFWCQTHSQTVVYKVSVVPVSESLQCNGLK